jgi:ankyrin repeat protein
MEIYRKLPLVPRRIVDKYYILLRRKFSVDNAERLIEYCNDNNRDSIIELLSNGMDLNMCIYNDCYPLRHILLNIVVNPEMVEFLLKHGADPNLTSSGSQRSNLSTAILRRSFQSAKLLLKYGADINVVSKDTNYTPLYTAVLLREKDIMRECLKYGADKDIKSREGMTAKNLATFLNDPEMCEMFE